MTPESVGVPKSQLVLGKHSGRHAFKKRLEELGVDLAEEDLNKAFGRFKDLCDRKKEVFDEDLLALVEDELLTASRDLHPGAPAVHQRDQHRADGHGAAQDAGRDVYQESGWGDGPVDAAYKAIDLITKMPGKLLEYQIRAVTGGQGRAWAR